MNKIRIATNEKALTIRLPDAEAEFWFGTLCRVLLDELPQETGNAADALPDAADEETADEETGAELPPEYEPVKKTGEPEETPPVAEESVLGEVYKPYKGFMHIICEHCGDIHTYCTRELSTQYHCFACGHDMPLHDLCRAFLNCECGKTYVYWTNATAELIEINCLDCKMPVVLERNRKGQYVSLQSMGG